MSKDGTPIIKPPMPTGCGQKLEKIQRLLQIEHRYENSKSSEWRDRMTWLRQEFQRVLDEQERLTPQPRDSQGRFDRFRNAKTASSGSETRDYTLKRLHRDAPELYEQVLRGELSAHAAAVKVGIRKKSVQVSGNLKMTARRLKAYYTAEQVRELVTLLSTRDEG